MRVMKLIGNEARQALKQMYMYASKEMLDTGANVSATYDISLIFSYKSFTTPQSVQIFDNNDKHNEDMSALGMGYLKIQSNEDGIMYWPVVYLSCISLPVSR